MSVNVDDIVLSALSTNFSFPILSSIGGITVDTTIEEDYEDAVEITEHPVEAGTQITDHSFRLPMQVRLRCGWSDSSPQAAIGNVNAIITGEAPFNITGSFPGGAMAASDYVSSIYSQLLQLQKLLQPIVLSTGLRIYNSMMLVSIRVRRDQATRYVLMVEAIFQEVIIVSTQTTTLAPQANQANPENTAEPVGTGTVLALPASPAPGGSSPPSSW